MRSFALLILGMLITSLTPGLDAVNVNILNQIFKENLNPFNYDLQLKVLPSKNKDAEVMICMHGMGGDSSLCNVIRSNPIIPYQIIAFNFPDYGMRYRDISKITFGTFDEIAPALFVLKKTIIDGGVDKVTCMDFPQGEELL